MKNPLTKIILFICSVFIIDSVITSSILFSNEKNSDDQYSRKADSGWYMDTFLGGRYNNDGFSLKTNIYYRFPLINNGGMLWENTGINIGIQEFISPAFQRISVYLKIMPIAFFDIASYAGHDYIYIGMTEGMKKVDSPDSEYDSESLDKIDGKPANGFRMSVIPRLKFAYRKIAAMYSLKIDFHNYYQSGYYYDYETNLIQKSKDVGLNHDGTLAYILGPFNEAGSFALALNLSSYRIQSTGESTTRLMLGIQNDAGWSILPENVSLNFKFAGGIHLHNRYDKGEPTFALGFGVKWRLY